MEARKKGSMEGKKQGREGGRKERRKEDSEYRARNEEAKEGPSSEGDTISHSRGWGHFSGSRSRVSEHRHFFLELEI